jgi:hypothetical protein
MRQELEHVNRGLTLTHVGQRHLAKRDGGRRFGGRVQNRKVKIEEKRLSVKDFVHAVAELAARAVEDDDAILAAFIGHAISVNRLTSPSYHNEAYNEGYADGFDDGQESK